MAGTQRSAASPAGGSSGEPELFDRVCDLVSNVELDVETFAAELAALESEYGETVYSELLYLMAHLRFDPGEARSHWLRILELRSSMQKRLRESVDVRVALVSYFVNVNRKLENAKVIELKLFQQTQASVYRDELTGLHNFRYLQECLRREVQHTDRVDSTLSLMMIDVDDFKEFNDRNGHTQGNEVLATIARLLMDSARQSDTVVRYGGEEFNLILSSTSKAGAFIVAERVRRHIEAHPFPNEASQPRGRLTVSIGVATYPADAENAEGLERAADAAMYVAKSRGKNRVCLFGENRRSYCRVAADLHGHYAELSAETHAFTTLNISAGGLLLLTERPLQVGSLLDLTLTSTSDGGRPISCSGRVVRIREREGGCYDAGIRIVDIARRDRVALTKYMDSANAAAAV